jgi:multicomponent Na+:H+ antiporter subunit C
MSAFLPYAAAGAALFALGLHAVAMREHLIRKILGLNVMGGGVFLLLVAAAARGEGVVDPVPHAMVLTGIVVAVSATAFALALARRIHAESRRSGPPGEEGDG